MDNLTNILIVATIIVTLQLIAFSVTLWMMYKYQKKQDDKSKNKGWEDYFVNSYQ